MQPLYYNVPTGTTSNYTGTDPLTSYSIATTHQMQPSYYNPNLYNSFTFNSIALATQITNVNYLGANYITTTTPIGNSFSNIVGGNLDTFNTCFSYKTVEFYSTLGAVSTQFSTYQTLYATDVSMPQVTFNYRFGTELQTLYFFESSCTSYAFTYANTFLQTIAYSGVNVATYYQAAVGDSWQNIGSSALETSTHVYESERLNTNPNVIYSSLVIEDSTPGFFTASSTFVNMLGSNVYTGLLVTTNSIIIYNNEQVSTYYSQSLSYQINIDNLTAALDSVTNTTGGSAHGSGIITVTVFSWAWTSLPGTGWTGTQVTVPTFQAVVNNYLTGTYQIHITNTTQAVTEVQGTITTENNSLSNSQTFLNNAVTTLQSQVSLAGQIINSLASACQAIITNMA